MTPLNKEDFMNIKKKQKNENYTKSKAENIVYLFFFFFVDKLLIDLF